MAIPRLSLHVSDNWVRFTPFWKSVYVFGYSATFVLITVFIPIQRSPGVSSCTTSFFSFHPLENSISLQ